MTFKLGKNIQIGQKIKTSLGWRKIKNVTSDDAVYLKEECKEPQEMFDCLDADELIQHKILYDERSKMEIKSYWQYETADWDNEANVFINKKLSEIKEKVLEVALDNKSSNTTIIRFLGGPTGFESYYLEDLLKNPLIGEKFYICFGTINSWAKCYVKIKDLEEILNIIKKENKNVQNT